MADFDARTALLMPVVHGGPDRRWRTEAMRSHSTGRLIHITRGQGRITVAGLTNGYGPNNLIYIPPQTMYGIEVGHGVFGQLLNLPRTPDWPDDWFHLRLMDVATQKELIKLFDGIEREQQNDGSAKACDCYLGLLSVFVERQLRRHATLQVDQRQNTAAARLVAQFTKLIEKDFTKHRSVAQYASLLNVTATHLSRSCQKTCSRSALELLHDRIYFAACEALHDTRKPINVIATDLGFTSAAYFARSFQDRSGLSPRDFRKMQRV